MAKPRRRAGGAPLKRKLLAAAALAGVLFAIACLVAKIGYDICFGRAGGPPAGLPDPAWTGGVVALEYATLDGDDFPRRAVEFPSGGNLLRGYVYGGGTEKGLVVLSHGVGAGAGTYLPDTLYFAQQGWQVLAYDNTGHHASEGKNGRGIVQSALDLEAALEFVKTDDKLKNLPVVLYGHSWGGYAVAAVLGRCPQVRAAASLAGFATPAQAMYDFAESRTGIFGVLAYPLFWGYHCLLFGPNANRSAVDSINAAGVPVMVVHGTEDKTLRYGVSGIISHAEEITNPRVVYITRDAPGQNGHGDLRFTPKGAALAAAGPAAAKTSVALAAGLDAALFEEMEAFYLAALA